MIRFAKPGLTEVLYIVQKNFQHHGICAICRFDEHEAKPIHDRQTHPLVRERYYSKTMPARVQLFKKKTPVVSLEELTGGDMNWLGS
jgi:hypothetical protein